jgi:hypothetical protein
MPLANFSNTRTTGAPTESDDGTTKSFTYLMETGAIQHNGIIR